MMSASRRPVVLQRVPDRFAPELQRELATYCELHEAPTQRSLEEVIAEHGPRIEAVITSAAVGADASLIEALPALKLISSLGVGLDRIDLQMAARRGVAVGYTPGVLDDCVADMAWALLLDVMRGLSAADRFVRSGAWAQGHFRPLGCKVSGSRLGVVGLGRIGQAIARRASGFAMPVRYHARRPVDGVPWTYEPCLIELARWADVLVVATSGGEGTRHLIDEAELEALGPHAYLINIARGTVVDEQALVRALQQRRIAGAGLDVFEREPEVPEALRSLDHVVLAPHMASATVQTRWAMAQRVLDNLRGYFEQGCLVSEAPRPQAA